MTGNATILHGLPGFLIAMAFVIAIICAMYVTSKNDDDNQGGFA